MKNKMALFSLVIALVALMTVNGSADNNYGYFDGGNDQFDGMTQEIDNTKAQKEAEKMAKRKAAEMDRQAKALEQERIAQERQKALEENEKLAMQREQEILNKKEMAKKQTMAAKKYEKHGKFAKTGIAYPTGNANTSTLYLEKEFPTNAKVGKEYEYFINVTNLTALDLNGVKISEMIPENFEVISAEPAIENKSGKKATWELGSLRPNDTVRIKVKGKSINKEDVPCCTTAEYDLPALCSTTRLVEPKLAVNMAAPKEHLVCNMIPLDFVVKNTGDTNLNDVWVKSNLPEGVTSTNKSDTLDIKVGNLAAGESKNLSAFVWAENSGTYNFKAAAFNEDTSASTDKMSTKVVKPSIEVTAQVDREKQFVGRGLKYTFNVKNTSDTQAEATMVTASIPKNAKFKMASDDGRQSGSQVKWNIGSLKAGEARDITMELTSTDAGTASSEVKADATCCDSTMSLAKAEVTGISALLLEVVDVVDPIEIGDVQTYKIQVTNQGTADATAVKIVAELEGMGHVENFGATTGSINENTLDFKPLATLGPKENAEWTIKVNGEKEGDLRFKVKLTSNELTRPVEETESTYVY